MSTAGGKEAAMAKKRKGPTATATTAFTSGSYHHAAATPFPIGRGHGAAAATTPSAGFGTVATASSQTGFGAAPAASYQAGFGTAAAASALFGFGTAAADSSPIYGRSFTDDSSHARGGSTGAPPVWWDAPDGGSPISPAYRHPTSWNRDNNSHPSGGFMGILNSQSNLHFAGAPSHYAPFKAPRPADVEGSFASKDASSSPDMEILSDNENVRIEKRIMWTPAEDERLMSDWIEHSTDSAIGADRKGEAYWGDVIKAYNKKTPPQRKKSVKQAKDRWHKINRWCYLFECDYVKARRVFTSGYSDEMWMDAADKFYEDHKIGPFVIKNVWKICRKVAKWITYNKELKNARKKKTYHLEEDVQNVESENEMLKRPPGQRAAKKARLAGKGKTQAMGDDGTSKESTINVERLDIWSKMQEEYNANRVKVLELQQKLSSDKIETTRLAHLTAQENRESKKLEIEGRKLEMEAKKLENESKKFEKESKMMDAYNNLISQDTSSMTDDEKAERVATMKCLRKLIFPEII